MMIKKYVLQNAIKFNGKANPGSIIGKLFAEDPELKKQAGELSKKIQDIVKEVNTLGLEEQTKQLQVLAPELLEKKEKEERNIFKFLGYKDSDVINTAFPPGPEKYPHIGHAKACLINYLLAKQYNGKFILRFEDTNPKLVKKEFYDIMIDDFEWLGVKPEEIIYASDYMEKFYEYAEIAIKNNQAYMCDCDQEKIKESRFKGTNCSCRDKSEEQNLKEWKEFLNDREKKPILRLKIDMKHKNSTMRDPTMFRAILDPHARLADKYHVWPNYDWQNSIMDSITGIDMRIRSKEFEMRVELQRHIQNLLGLRESKTYEFARFNMTGMLMSGRSIREKIENKEIIGWDDPIVGTIVALKRRGFTPEAIKNFVVSTGISKSESTLTWEDLIMHNRRQLNDTAERYWFIKNPKKIIIENAPAQEIKLRKHPEDESKGYRVLETLRDFYLSEDDYKKLEDAEEGTLFRLIDCLNFRKTKNGFEYDSKTYEDFKDKGKILLNFLPINKDIQKVEIFKPDHALEEGYCEKEVFDLRENDIIQFERYGFCRLDKKEENLLRFWYAHK